jgi:hypothetical protein
MLPNIKNAVSTRVTINIRVGFNRINSEKRSFKRRCLRLLSSDVNSGCEAYVGAHIRRILTKCTKKPSTADD